MEFQMQIHYCLNTLNLQLKGNTSLKKLLAVKGNQKSIGKLSIKSLIREVTPSLFHPSTLKVSCNTRQKSWDTLYILNLDGAYNPSSPLPMLVTGRTTCGDGKTFRAQ